MTEDEVSKTYAKLLTDINFERLELILKNPNIFSSLNISHYEIRHSNFLAWLLDPLGNHGLNDFFLKRLLIKLFDDNRATKVNTTHIPRLLKSSIIVHREWHNIDILIEFEDTVIAIENKIKSTEHSNQLERYFKAVEQSFPKKRKVLCYLTLTGTQSSMTEKYIELGYTDILTDLNDIILLYGNSINPKVKIYIEDYIDTLKMNVLEESESNELAKEIYKNHKDLLDFIFDNKPDISSEYLSFIKEYYIQKGYHIGSPNKGVIRILPKSLVDLLPSYDKNFGGLPNKEPLVFEIDFFWSPGKIIFKVVVPPSDYALKQILEGLIETLPNAKKPTGKKWSTYFNTKEKFDIVEMLKSTDDQIYSHLDKFHSQIEKYISSVEEVLLNNKYLILEKLEYK